MRDNLLAVSALKIFGRFRLFCVPIDHQLHELNHIFNQKIHNGRPNCTEWSAIWSEIKRVITKSHDRKARVRFVITSLISDQNCTTRSAIPLYYIHFEIR